MPATENTYIVIYVTQLESYPVMEKKQMRRTITITEQMQMRRWEANEKNHDNVHESHTHNMEWKQTRKSTCYMITALKSSGLC